MKKLLFVAILMLALVFTVVACNNDKPDNDTTVGETTVEVTPGTTAEPDPDVTDEPVVTEPDTTEAPVTTQAPDTTAEPPTTAPVVTTEPATTEAPVDPSEPVWIIDAAGLADKAAGGNMVAAELNDAGYVHLTSTGGDPYFQFASGLGAMPNYMAIRYRTNTTQNGQFFLGSGGGPNGQGDFFEFAWNGNGEWNLLVFDLSTCGATSITDGVLNYIRFDYFTGGGAEGDYMDVEYIAIFNSAEYAEAYDFELHPPYIMADDAAAGKVGVAYDSFWVNGSDYFNTAATGNVGAKLDEANNTITFGINDAYETVMLRGWGGFNQPIASFGYFVDNYSMVYGEFAAVTEDPVKGAGGEHASRFEIAVPLAELERGTHTIGFVAKLEDGTVVLLHKEITVVIPTNYENNNVPMDSWNVSGHKPGVTPAGDATHGGMVAAGGLEQGALLHQGAIYVGEIDLSKYSQVIVYCGCDASDVTQGHYNANANNRIILAKVDSDHVNAPAEEDIIAAATYTLHGWAPEAVVIDLSGIDYNGPVYVSYDTLPGTFMLVGAIEFIGGEIVDEPETEEPETETQEPETEEPEPVLTPEEIVDAAYGLANGESLEGTYTLTGVITSIDTPYSNQYGNITVTIQVGDMADKLIQCFRLKGEGAADLKVTDTITVTGSLKNYKGTIEFDAGCSLDAVVPGEGPAEPTYTTPEEIVNAAYALEVGASLSKEYTLTGVIISVDTVYSENYKNVTVTMVVGDMTDKPIQCFRLKGEGADVIAVGDTITVTGVLINYNGKIEFNSGCVLNSYEPAPIPEPVPGSEELPLVWEGDVEVAGAHDVWYTYTAAEDGILVITYPAGNWISGLANKTDAAYSINVTKGQTVTFNIFGNNEGTYSGKMVKLVDATQDGLCVDEAEVAVDTSVLFLDKGAFAALIHTGSVEIVGDSIQFVYNVNGVVSDPIEAIEATAYSITVPADALKLGGNLIKIGVVIDGLTVEYFWEYTVVVETTEETETAEPETEEPTPDESETPVEPEEPTVNTLDFSTFASVEEGKKDSAYTDRANSDGWTAAGARIEVTAKESADIITDGISVIALNGKTSAVGTLTSPVLAGGIQSISFNLAYFWSESSDISLTLTITAEDGTVITETVLVADPAVDTAYEYAYTLATPIEGNFTIEIENNSPSNVDKNKDRVAIWNFSWISA